MRQAPHTGARWSSPRRTPNGGSWRDDSVGKQQILERLQQARAAFSGGLVALVAGVPDEQATGETRFRRRLRLDTYGHYPKHAAAIRAWRKSRAPEPRPRH